MFDLENELPEELMATGNSWGSVETNKPPATGPGPGPSMGPSLQNGALDIPHHLMQQGNKGLVNHMQGPILNTPNSQGLMNNQGMVRLKVVLMLLATTKYFHFLIFRYGRNDDNDQQSFKYNGWWSRCDKFIKQNSFAWKFNATAR